MPRAPRSLSTPPRRHYSAGSGAAEHLSRIEQAALTSIQERPQHFQLVVGGMRTIRSLEKRGLVTLNADLYVYPSVAA
jgi:hypothetical protein